MSLLARRLYLLLLIVLLPGTAFTTELRHWPQPQAAQLDALITSHAHQNEFAVFDLDNTTYENDVEEALLPWLENQQLLTRKQLPPALQLIPFDDQSGQPESLYSYYHRLCELDELVCYPWAAQVFSGFTVGELKAFTDAMMQEQQPIPVVKVHRGKAEHGAVWPPKVLPGMQELFSKLRENGIRVYIISAAHEELARAIASDPRYGYLVAPENVLGVNTLLRNSLTGELTTARWQIRAGTYLPANNRDLVLTSYLVGPMTWYEGKAATILAWIDQWRKPILVGGDTLCSDTFMLLNSTNVAGNGLRLWVNRNEETRNKLKIFLKKIVSGQKAARVTPDADQNWIMVQQSELR